MGHDYVLTLGGFLDGYLWYNNNGFFTPPWFTPSFCGGQALFADPQSAFYSLPQFLTFIVDPLQAVYWAFLVFAALGFWGMYLYSKSCLKLGQIAALVAACIFMFNGFYAHRMIIGHYGYQSFMLVPLIAWLLLKPPSGQRPAYSSITNALLAGILIAYWFHSGLTTLMIPAALAVITLACLSALRNNELTAKTFLLRGLLAGIVSIGLSASKLNANLTLMGNFSRDYYPLPGISDSGELLNFVFQSLFYSSEHVYQTVTPLWKNMQWAAMPHELAFGLTPLPLLILVVGTGLYALSRQGKNLPPLNTTRSSLPSIVLFSILLIPIALLYYSPEWNAVLKEIPLIGSTTSPYRWLIIYIPLLAAISGIAINAVGKFKLGLAAIALVGVPLLNSLENREYYQQQDFDPAPMLSYYNAVQRGNLAPAIILSADLKYPNGEAIINNNLFLQGVSGVRCYNPLYGYRLEKLTSSMLVTGSVMHQTGENSLNLHNPACLVFPNENQCKIWSPFTLQQKEQLQQFSNYKPFDFIKSKKQAYADLITLLSVIMLITVAGTVAVSSLLRQRRNPL
jgi:hypothetical protein